MSVCFQSGYTILYSYQSYIKVVLSLPFTNTCYFLLVLITVTLLCVKWYLTCVWFALFLQCIMILSIFTPTCWPLVIFFYIRDKSEIRDDRECDNIYIIWNHQRTSLINKIQSIFRSSVYFYWAFSYYWIIKICNMFCLVA